MVVRLRFSQARPTSVGADRLLSVAARVFPRERRRFTRRALADEFARDCGIPEESVDATESRASFVRLLQLAMDGN
jgi:hypothetical protein